MEQKILGRITLRQRTKLMYGLLCAALLCALIFGTYRIGFSHAFLIILASPFIFLMPGLCMTLLMFPHRDYVGNDTVVEKGSLDIIERSTLSVLLSIVISSALVLLLNGFPGGSKLTQFNLSFVVLGFNFLLISLIAVIRWLKIRHN